MNHKIQRLAVSGEGFVFDPTNGDSFNVNATGLVCLEGLKQGKDYQQMAQDLEDGFEVSSEQAERDVLSFVHHLQAYRLL